MISRCLGAAVLLGALSLSAAPASAKRASGPELRDQEQAACYNDAMTLCKDDVPDEAKIEACMRKNISKVSAGCKAFFK